jgi:GntR family transcriptional regulator
MKTNPEKLDRPALARSSAQPLHAQLKEDILRNLRSGKLPSDSPIPSERELCEKYDISRTTVRKAIADLTHEGWLYVVSGKGTFVSGQPLKQDIEPLVGFSQDLERQGVLVVTEILSFQRMDADDELSHLLNVRPGSAIINLSRLRSIASSPIAVQTVFMPEHLCPGILGFDFAAQSLYDILRCEYGLRLTSGSTTIEASLADKDERNYLRLPEPSPVLRTQQITLLDDGTVMELCRSSFHGLHFALQVPGGKANFAGVKKR